MRRRRVGEGNDEGRRELAHDRLDDDLVNPERAEEAKWVEDGIQERERVEDRAREWDRVADGARKRDHLEDRVRERDRVPDGRRDQEPLAAGADGDCMGTGRGSGER